MILILNSNFNKKKKIKRDGSGGIRTHEGVCHNILSVAELTTFVHYLSIYTYNYNFK